MTKDLPVYSAEALAASSMDELWNLLVRNQDRVPRNLIDECAGRGDQFADRAAALLEKDYFWSGDQSEGEWWLRLHVVMILGLVPGARAGELLVAYMRKMDEAQDDNLQDWLAGHWPALFENKPLEVLPHLAALSEDRARDSYIRANAVGTLLASAGTAGEQAVDLAARIAFDDTEDFDMRSLTGNYLLDFARAEHRAGLEALAALQPAQFAMFHQADVESAFASGPQLRDDHRDPWLFYTRDAIEARQLRWTKENAEAELDDDELVFDDAGETYVRSSPKVGRNDPCPCGSGKKYKKCCLANTV